MEIIKRLTSETPLFFKKIRNIGGVLTAISVIVLTAPVSLPAVIVSIAGYMSVAGGIATVLAQTATIKE